MPAKQTRRFARYPRAGFAKKRTVRRRRGRSAVRDPSARARAAARFPPTRQRVSRWPCVPARHARAPFVRGDRACPELQARRCTRAYRARSQPRRAPSLPQRSALTSSKSRGEGTREPLNIPSALCTGPVPATSDSSDRLSSATICADTDRRSRCALAARRRFKSIGNRTVTAAFLAMYASCITMHRWSTRTLRSTRPRPGSDVRAPGISRRLEAFADSGR